MFVAERDHKKFLVIIGLALMMFWAGCAGSGKQGPRDGYRVFYNSFETPQDTSRWYWAGTCQFSHDAAPGGGTQALLVKGGRLLPAGSFITRPLKYGGYFTIRFWAKMVDVGGYVELSTIADHEVGESIHVPIYEPSWMALRSADTLYCPPNQSLMLTVQAGAMVEGQVLVDMLEVRKVGSAKRKPKTVSQASMARKIEGR